MQTVRKSTETKTKIKKSVKDETVSKIKKSVKDETVSKKPPDEKINKSAYSVSTPRNLLKKSAADIYGQTKNSSPSLNKAPRKVFGTTHKSNDVSPMKGLLKSSSSTVSNISAKHKNSPITKNDAKVPSRLVTPRSAITSSNVTVNSPIVKKRISKDGKTDTKDVTKRVETRDKEKKNSGMDLRIGERERSKTRTLSENEVKVLTIDGVDNNAEMLNLSKKLAAKPKAFYVDLDESKLKKGTTQNVKTSDDEVSYEDDFESYESDFESYHESHSENESMNSNNSDLRDNKRNTDRESDNDNNIEAEERRDSNNAVDVVSKDLKDEEKMLDSGNYELRENRSATKSKPVMDFILEGSEVDSKSSLTDEGFQEMSASAVSSIRTIHTEVLERPLFVDFAKSKDNKRKRKVFEKLKQRATDILSMVTLHEMSYSLFEMKPIPYDVYMATFGRTNYMQCFTQTFDDGVSEEMQTETIASEHRWTQHPIQFSNSDIYLNTFDKPRKHSTTEDYITKFGLEINNVEDEYSKTDDIDQEYKSNPLRMFFEQKDGAGTCTMLPYDSYKDKLKRNEFNNGRLGKFLKRVGPKVTSILSANSGFHVKDIIKNTKYPFSTGYVVVPANNVENEKMKFLSQTKVTGIVLSESKSDLMFTIHTKCQNVLVNKNILCLWDVNIDKQAPLKILVAVHNVSLARFKGKANGIFVAALTDGSIHLWDLSENPIWQPHDVSEKPIDVAEVKSERLTQTERDREWNKINSHAGFHEKPFSRCLLQACAYTTSAAAMMSEEALSQITGLEVTMNPAYSYESNRKMLGQVSALQRLGVITIWSIIQEKIQNDIKDLGKAYWSKMKLEKNQVISLAEQLATTSDSLNASPFNLKAAKTRIAMRKKENTVKRLSRQKSAVTAERPISAASNTIGLDNCLVCTDLKAMKLNDNYNYLVAKNCGEVLCCTKILGVVKINRFCVANDFSTVTNLEVSPHTSPHFLAATDAGTVSLCSLSQARVLLTLDCRTYPMGLEGEKYEVDSKGRFISSSVVRQQNVGFSLRPDSGIAVSSVVWCGVNPCCLYALLSSGGLVAWDLTRSDINATCAIDRAAVAVSCSGDTLALVTPDGEVQVHRLNSASRDSRKLDLFKKYVSLL